MVRPLEPVDHRTHSLKPRNTTTKGMTLPQAMSPSGQTAVCGACAARRIWDHRDRGVWRLGCFWGWCKYMIPMKRSTHCSSFTDSGLAACTGRQNASPAFVPSGSDRGGWQGSIAMNAQVMDSVRFGSCSLTFQT